MRRYTSLDGLRGVAAIMVMAYHVGQRSRQFMPLGYLAVDLFFALSGFVLAGAYIKRFDAGLTVRRFVEERLVRVYPMYFIGFLIGLLVAAGQLLHHHQLHTGISDLARTAAFNLFGLPDIGNALLYPINTPSWSLFLEVVINVVFAFGLFQARPVILIAICLVSAACLAVSLDAPFYANVGWGWANLGAGCFRTSFSFTLGILLYRTIVPRLERRISVCAIIPFVLLVITLAMPIWQHGEIQRELFAIFLILPICLMLGALWEPPAYLRPACKFLGDVSFPLYAVHWPLIALFSMVRDKTHLPDAILTAGYCVGIIVLAGLLTFRVDAPVRRAIAARLAVKPTAQPIS